jgi:hypothetical protein
MTTETILTSEYNPPQRPYSEEELNDMRVEFHNRINLGKYAVYHNKCEHFYRVKKDGKKERVIIKQNKDSELGYDIGNCSICWKLKNLDPELKSIAQNMISEYMYYFFETTGRYTYSLHDLERVFYTWLYLEKK